MELEEYREKINSIDKELVALFEKRMDMAALVAEYKKANNMEIFHMAREKEVVEKSLQYLENDDYREYLVEFMEKIMDLSKKLQFSMIK